MTEGLPNVERAQVANRDAGGAPVRPRTLTLSKSGQALCAECTKREAASRRNRWIVIGAGKIRYVVTETAPGERKVSSVSNADQLTAEYVKYMSQFGSF